MAGPLFAGLAALALSWAPAAPPVHAVQKQSVFSRGVVEAIREMPSETEGGLRRFEMTIRMRDGTMRVSQETGGARWRAGEAVSLIGNADAADL